MKLIPLALELKHFEKQRELRHAPKRLLEDPEKLQEIVDSAFRNAESQDNESSDYDPLPGRILTTREGEMSRIRYQTDEKIRSLERYQVHYRERTVLRIEETADTLHVFHSYSNPECPHSLSCWNLDRKHPEKSFFQEDRLDPDPWLCPGGWPL